ncbi:MAG: hypothetical protein GXP39_05760 [Chloroflexi bacterium]|nr:hypothetical protein [Chloroflexota bacterium]
MLPALRIRLLGALIIIMSVAGAWPLPATAAGEPNLYPLNTPYGAVVSLAQHPIQPNDMWAIASATTAGRSVTALYRTQDGGESWKPAGNDLSWLTLMTIAISPTGTLYLGTSNGLFRRAAGDPIWIRVPLENAMGDTEPGYWPERGMTIRQVLLPATDPTRIYVIAAENHKYAKHWLFRSRDGGQTFERLLVQEFDTNPGSGLGRVLVDPTDIDRLYAATRGGILISQDGGNTWIPGGLDPSLTQGMTVLALTADDPPTLFAARLIQDDRGFHLALARSQDRGRSWSEAILPIPGSPPLDLIALPDHRLVLATRTGVFLGSWEDNIWEAMEGDLGAMGANQLLLDQREKGTLWAATPLGVYRWNQDRAIWVAHNQGLPPNGSIRALYSFPDRPQTWLAAMAWGGGYLAPPALLRSEDGGRSWHVTRGLGETRVNALVSLPDQPERVYAATYDGICQSLDNGRTWTKCALQDTIIRDIQVDPHGTLYAGTYGAGLYRSDDGGDTWTQIGFADARIGSILIRSDGLYVTAQDGEPGLYRSTDGGASWQKLPWPVASGADMAQLVGNDQLLIATVAEQGLWISEDGGRSWRQAPGLPTDVTFDVVWTDPRSPERILAARQDAGLWISEDGGHTWLSIGHTLGDNKVTAIAADYRSPEDVVVGTSHAGIWASGQPGSESPSPEAVDARIEIVWPHGWAPVAEATRANMSLRLFYPDSLEPVPCGWEPRVEIWEARDSEPARFLAQARRRPIGDALSTMWDLNDMDVSYAQRPDAKLYYLVRVPDAITRTSMWAHAADPRTYYPQPTWPSAVATAMPEKEIDARILVVWPHDTRGRPRSVEEADLANVRVGLYLPGTFTSIPPERDLVVRLIGALDNGIGRTVGIGHMRIATNGFSYPVWDFDNIDVSAARDGRSRWAFWVEVDGYVTRSNVWVHGVDARTRFPIMDQPIVGCRP